MTDDKEAAKPTQQIKDLDGLCQCPSNSQEPHEHEMGCPYRMKYDAITVNFAMSQEEVMAANIAFGIILTLHDNQAGISGAPDSIIAPLRGLHDKTQEALKQIAAMRTGQVSVEEGEDGQG